MTIFDTIGSRISFYRIHVMDVSQRQMEEDLNLTKGTVNNYEQGKARPNDQFVKKASEYFGCTPEMITEGIPNESQYGFEALSEIEKVKGVDPMHISHVKACLIAAITKQEAAKKAQEDLDSTRLKLGKILSLTEKLRDDISE